MQWDGLEGWGGLGQKRKSEEEVGGERACNE